MEESPFRVKDWSFMKSLPAGTIVEFDTFATLVVGHNLLLVFESSDSSYVQEGNLLHLVSRGNNDWSLSLHENYLWESYDYWIKRDWNGRVNSQHFDEYDRDYWDYDDSPDFYEYEEYDADDY